MGREIKLAELKRREVRERIEKSWNENTPIYQIIRSAFGKKVFAVGYHRKKKIHKGIILDVGFDGSEDGRRFIKLELTYCSDRIKITINDGTVINMMKLEWDEIEKCWIPIVW